MNVLTVGLGDVRVHDPDDFLDRVTTLTGWSESLIEAGARRVDVVQRFHRDALIERRGVTYTFCADHGSMLYPATSLGRFRRAIERARPDVAHVNGLEFRCGSRVLRGFLPHTTPIVIQDHANGLPVRVGSKALSRAAFRSVDGFLFTGRQQADRWRNARIIHDRHRVYDVLESSTTLRPIARGAARRASGIEGSPALLWVGRLNANKDPLTVLAGFERIIATWPDARLTMVFGSNDLLPDVKAKLEAAPALASRVRLVGFVPHAELPAYYSAADIFVLGSHHEGSGYALIEACACGTVPVVTSIPSFRAITGDGARGALWPPGDEVSLGQALLDMASRDLASLRTDLEMHFARELSWPAVARRALDIYADVRERRRSSR